MPRLLATTAAAVCQSPELQKQGGCTRCLEYFGESQMAAVSAVRRAVLAGKLPPVKGQTCADCDAPATEYDHRDYSKPLDVAAVCRKCNQRRGSAMFVCDPPAEKGWLTPPGAFKHAFRNFYVVGKDGKLRLLYPAA